ncbi:MAG: hypothetical protein JNM66_18460 [Bryobacterales bacterium]|nr:hypothetical protein [Bryobacterales bacterium]
MNAAKLFLGMLLATAALPAQRVFVEADPDFYFDRGLTVSAGFKPDAASRWAFLGDFASRKAGAAGAGRRLEWRAGAGVRYRFYGKRNGLFGQLNGSADRIREPLGTAVTPTVRPGIGAQWFPWRARGLYVLPLLALENYAGRAGKQPRMEFRIGKQF